MLAEIPDVWVFQVLLTCPSFLIQFVCEVDHCIILYVFPLRTSYQMRGVTAFFPVAHKVPDNERLVLALVVRDELGKVSLSC